jgi:hypothetical protein
MNNTSMTDLEISTTVGAQVLFEREQLRNWEMVLCDMAALATADNDFRELDHRNSDGIHVTLLWNPSTNRVFVWVVDVRTDSSVDFEVMPADALDAFHHPYAFAEYKHRQDARTPRDAFRTGS